MQPAKLSPKVRRLLEDPANDLMVSATSAWETATKFRLGKLSGAKSVPDDFDDVARRLSAGILPISHVHALPAGSYPQSHRDPFDRILAAQVETEGTPLVSRDRALREFGVELLW